jgi:hypothetical protein
LINVKKKGTIKMANTTAQQHFDNLPRQDQQHVDRIAKHLDENPHHGQAMTRHSKNQDHPSATAQIKKIAGEIGITISAASAAGLALYFIKL